MTQYQLLDCVSKVMSNNTLNFYYAHKQLGMTIYRNNSTEHRITIALDSLGVRAIFDYPLGVLGVPIKEGITREVNSEKDMELFLDEVASIINQEQ